MAVLVAFAALTPAVVVIIAMMVAIVITLAVAFVLTISIAVFGDDAT